MIYWMKRRIERSRERCRKAHRLHKRTEPPRAGAEMKPEQKTSTASRIYMPNAMYK